jgi:acyl dehydratase
LNAEPAAWPSGPPVVGQRAELSREVSAREIEMFTAISGDRNPLHYDAAWAAAALPRPSRT